MGVSITGQQPGAGHDDDLKAIGFVEVLRRVRDLHGWKILAFLMGRHCHLVLKTLSVDLLRSMARLQGSVSRSYNRGAIDISVGPGKAGTERV